ncbi:acylneuraminate cytidylyltransferase family protein [Pedobacter psychroterrae]|uniref:Acylneuraminate cytidylyltransferase family protein n=1 Tax=Pedobacter psychroterrae TaxID=2530453 RepID=A0A4R0NUK3_9SPHI|nr:acylneuraminate cytidylyltransferase family protein [Pedobacter psychroterrae]TCD02704.1 acylneuraminate cytidylyltransferase family protein [Pedobacter psychroterrae]
MKPLVIIPARGGSKGVPGKNIKLLNGKPLIHYSIEAAIENFEKEIICISTDSPDIKSCAEATGIEVPFLRPGDLATDSATTYDVLRHAISFYESNGYKPDVLILLQPTSPFRTANHISEALNVYLNSTNIDMVVSVKETKANPYYLLFEEDAEGFLHKSKKANFTSRQECPKVWEYNGAIYIMNIQNLKKQGSLGFERVVKYVMDEFSSLDIDTPFDFKLAESMLNEKY